MRRQLLIYLVIFLILTNAFTYMFFKKNSVILAKTEVSKTHKQKIDSLEQLVFDYSLFSIASNQKSLDYFENKKTGDYLSPDQIQSMVRESLYKINEKPQENKLIDVAQLSGKPYLFDGFRVINHRWVIAAFSDGKYTGEVFLKYFIEDDKSVSFEPIQAIIFN
jgi:hypothetical protein